jgi:hypothetical protein
MELLPGLNLGKVDIRLFWVPPDIVEMADRIIEGGA